MLANIPRLVTDYFALAPDVGIASQRVAFGTSGHRGSSSALSFNEAHILAITQAVCQYRHSAGINGPLFLGMDTHALSEAAFASALEVLAANGVETMIDVHNRYTPTPVISHAVLTHNRRGKAVADGIVISPSHNPPDEGGFKYNSANGGPADISVTTWIERSANEFFLKKLAGIKRIPYARARMAACVHSYDYTSSYVGDLANVIDLDAIRLSGVRIGIDPLGGASVHYWPAIIDRYKIAATVVNDAVDPTFRFMDVDHDGKIRMDCSSPYAMASLIRIREQFDIAFANDTDADRHGIITPTGLMEPNSYLTAAIAYLYSTRPGWREDSAVGKTIVSSGMIDRVTAKLARKLLEVPVGFKWFSAGLGEGSLGFAGEESAGATFLRRDGSVWTTDKDGLILGLLGAEITARSGKDPYQYNRTVTDDLGKSYYQRIDAPAMPQHKRRLAKLEPSKLSMNVLGGEEVVQKLTHAPGNGQSIGGIKVVANSGWFAARPSGTENVFKLYAESFRDESHLKQIQDDARREIARILAEPE
jgi:phosphoglucomutase